MKIQVIKKTFLFMALVVFTFIFGANYVLAQTATPTSIDQATAAQIRTRVLSDIGNPTDITGFTKCSDKNFALGTCAEIEKSTGTILGTSLSYKSGDTVKCSYSNAGIDNTNCAITNANGTTYYSNGISGNIVTADPKGNFTNAAPITRQDNEINGVKAVVGAPVTSPTGNSSSGCSLATGNISVTDCLLVPISLFIFGIANTLLGFAGIVLNLVVVRTIFQFSSLIGNSPGLLIAWGLLRDISNMILLFGFVYIGISTILGLSTYTVQKTLPQLLIFAVLLNFSLFAAEAVIDSSNLLSSVMYSQANTGTCLSSNWSSLGSPTQSDADCAVNYGIAGHIMQSTGLSSVFASNAAGSGAQEGLTLVGLAIFAVIGTVVIIAMAIMFAIRAIVLTFIMVTAPIGFAGMAIPQLRTYADRWWKALIQQSFFAPVMLLLVFVSLKVTDSFGRNGSLGAALGNSNTNSVSVIFIFIIVCGFLLASLKIASDMGAVGANKVIRFSKNIGYAAPRLIGRETVGRASDNLKDRYNKSGFSRLLVKTPGLRGLDRGVVSTLDKGREAKFGGTISYAADKKRIETRNKELDDINKKVDEDKAKEDRKKELEDAVKMPETTAAEKDAKNDKIAEILERMNNNEIQELDDIKKSGANLELIARNLSPERFAAIVKDTNTTISEDAKAKARDARFNSLKNDRDILNDPARATEHADAKKRIKSYSAKDLQNAPAALLDDDTVLANLSDSQRDDLLKSGNVSPATARKIKKFDPVEVVKADYATAVAAAAAPLAPGAAPHPTPASAVSARIASMTPKQVAKLDDDILADPDITKLLTPQILNEIDRVNTLDRTKRAVMISTLASVPTGTNPQMDRFLSGGAGLRLWT